MNAKKRILIIKLSSFGDIFHALPAVNNLKIALDAEIDWVTQPEYVDLVKCFPVISTVIPFPRREFMTRGLGFFRTLRGRHYDLVIDLQGLLKSAIVARLARGTRTIGPSFQREGARFFYDAVAGRCNKNRHAVEENLDVVRYLGLPVSSIRFPVTFPAPWMPQLREWRLCPFLGVKTRTGQWSVFFKPPGPCSRNSMRQFFCLAARRITPCARGSGLN
jgi:heptosyltransferase I